MQKNYTSCRETPVKYDYVAKLLLLDEEDRCINLRLLNDAFQDVKAYLDCPLDEFFDSESLPKEILEACVSLFIMKHSLYKDAADFAKGDDMEDVLERKFDSGEIDFDAFFSKFSYIPGDIALLLDKFRESTALLSA